MIDNLKEKLKSGLVTFEFAESGNIAVLERRYDEHSGVPVMKPTQEMSTAQVKDLIADNERQMQPFIRRGVDLNDLLAEIGKKEAEREALEKANENKDAEVK